MVLLNELMKEKKHCNNEAISEFIVSLLFKARLRVRFFGKMKKRICDLGSMDSSASKKRKIRKRIIFHDNENKQTQSCAALEKFLNENATRKKNTLAIDKKK